MKKPPFLLTFISLLIAQIIAVDVFGLNRFIVAPIAAGLLYLIYRNFGLNREDIGASKVSRKALIWSAAILGSIFLLLGIVYLIAPNTFMDERFNQSLTATLVSMFIILPLTTVLLEEFAFRGILLGYLLKNGSKNRALIISSVLFGLWHVFSSQDVHVGTFLFIHNPPQLLVAPVIVLVTGAAGWVFSILRIKTKSILTPIVAHWSLNAAGLLFAWLAWHR